MSEGVYPVEWQGVTYHLSDLTVGVKKKFCTWLRQRLKAEAIEDHAGRPDVRDEVLASVGALVWWGDVSCSPTVAQWLQSLDGGRQLNRLLFGESAKAMSDADFGAMLKAKEADPASDYMAAIHSIRDAAGPK
jgi:hypothetical protein